jgi:hypothetical protein
MSNYPRTGSGIRPVTESLFIMVASFPRHPRDTGLMAALCIGLALMLLTTQAAKAGDFQPHSLDGFNMHSERDADGDGDGVNETRIKQYLNQEGDSLVSMSSKGRLWAWSLNTNNNNSAVQNYVIRDSDCDGIFDEVYSLDDDFQVPECVK